MNSVGPWRKAAVAAVFGMLITGCTLGPDFVAPQDPSAAQYTAPEETPDSKDTAVPASKLALGAKVTAEWWTLFHSQEIDRLVRQAIADSPTLEAATARLTVAQEQLVAISGTLDPQVDANASATRAKINAAAFGLSPSAFRLPPNYNAYQLGPSVSYALDVFGGMHRQVEQQAALADAQRYALAAAYQTLTGSAVTEALQIAVARAQLKALRDILDLDRQNLDLVRKEREGGAVPDSDVVSAESQLAADETLLPPIEQQLDVARHALAVLLGRAPAEWSPPGLDLADLTLPGEVPVSLPSELVHQRPDIVMAEADLHATSAAIGVATAQLYPSITLTSSVAVAALNPGHLFNPESMLWSIAAGLTAPLYDGGTREANRQAALADFKASAATYKTVVLGAFQQVADTMQALTHDGELLQTEQQALDFAAESTRLQRISYGAGGSGILQLLDAQRQYQQARLGYVRAEAQRYQDTAALLVAMGGGWWEAGLDEGKVAKASVEADGKQALNSGTRANSGIDTQVLPNP